MANGTGSGGDGGDIFSGKFVEEADDAAESTDKLAESQRQLVDDANDLKKQIDANTDALKDYGRGADGAKRKFETLTEAVNKQKAAVIESANKLGTLNAKVHEIGRGMTGFMGKMQEAISLGGIYNRTLKELEQSQKAYVGSLSLTTATQGKATAEHTKFLKAINKANQEAGNIAGEYAMDVEEVRKSQAKLVGTFGAQLVAYGANKKELMELNDQTIMLSKYMGIDAAEAADYMKVRLDQSGKTLEEVRKETNRVALAVDSYSIALTNLSGELLHTANITKKEMLTAVQDASKAFDQGVFNAESYAKSLGPLIIQMKKLGATKSELKLMVAGFQKFSKSLQEPGLKSLFGVKGAQMLARNLDMISDPKVRMRVEHAIEKSGGDITDPQAIRRITEAVAGSTAQQYATFRMLQEVTGGDQKLIRELVYTQSGSQRVADEIAEMSLPNSPTMQMLAKGNRRTEKETAALNKQMEKLKGVVKKGSDTTSPAHKIALSARDIQQKILSLMKYYYPAMLAAMAAQAVGSFIKGGGSTAARVLGMGGTAAGVGGAAAGAGGLLGKGGSAQASRIAARKAASSGAAQRAVAGGVTKGGAKVAMKTASKGATKRLVGAAIAKIGAKFAARGALAAVPVVGQIAVAALTAYEAIEAANVYGGKYMKTKLPKYAQNMVGEQTSVLEQFEISQRRGTKGFNFLENITRVRGVQVATQMEALVKEYSKAEGEMRDHESGKKILNEKEWRSRKKFLKEHERAVRLQRRFNFEATKDSKAGSKAGGRRFLTGTKGTFEMTARGKGVSDKEQKKIVQGDIDRWLSGTASNRSTESLEALLSEGGTIKGAGPVETATMREKMKKQAAAAGINWGEFKELVRKRAGVATNQDTGTYDPGAAVKLEKFSLARKPGDVGSNLMDKWRAKKAAKEAKAKAAVGRAIPQEVGEGMTAGKARNINVSASVIEGEDGETSTVDFNPVDETVTIKKGVVVTQVIDGVGLAKGVGEILGRRTPNTTNAPGK